VNLRAVAMGAAVALAVAVPIATIGSVVLDDDSALVLPLAVVVLAGFVAGGMVAGRPREGAIAALIGIVVPEIVSTALDLAGDDDVHWAALAANVVVAVALGGVGGFAAGEWRRFGQPR
jgi:hypothetical protein